jgi:hypothetical protein
MIHNKKKLSNNVSQFDSPWKRSGSNAGPGFTSDSDHHSLTLCSLPADVLQQVCAFLPAAADRQLLHASLHIHREYRRYRHLTLNPQHSLRYCRDSSFRQRVLSVVWDPRRQVSLDFSRSDVTPLQTMELEQSMQVYSVKLRKCLGVSQTLVNVLGSLGLQSLDLSYCELFSDVTSLGSIPSLKLDHCYHITDVSALGSVHNLSLLCCHRVTDVSALGSVYTLNLAGCEGVCDVSALGQVHNLDLACCINITDVSALGNVYSLNLAGCNGVCDVSSLGGVHILSLLYTPLVTDVSALGGVHTLNLGRCANRLDLSCLGGVRNLNLSGYSFDIPDVSVFAAVHTLNLTNCITNSLDLSSLAAVPHLITTGLRHRHDILPKATPSFACGDY